MTSLVSDSRRLRADYPQRYGSRANGRPARLDRYRAALPGAHPAAPSRQARCMAVVLALGSALAFGSGDFLGGLASRRAPAPAVVVTSQVFGLFLVLGAIAVLPPVHATPVDALWGAAAGLGGGLGVVLLYRGLAIGPMGLVAPVTAVGAAVLPVVIGLTLGERPSLRVGCGVALAVPAIALVSSAASPAPSRRGRSPLTPALWLALGSGAAFGVFYIALQRAGPDAGLWPLASARTASILAFLAVAAARRRSPIPPRPALPSVLSAGALDMAANVLLLLAVRRGLLSIVVVVTSLYPAATVLLAALVLDERLRRPQLLGLITAMAAVVLIASG